MSALSDRNPYVGPRPIQQGEPLYGRRAEVAELYHLLQARRIVVLHSPSGAGKSSLVQAGLIPRLKDGKFDVWKPIRVNLDPEGLEGVPAGTNRYLLSAMLSLEEELPEARRRGPAALAGLDFLAYLESRPRRKGREGQPAVLLFDQFEEVLTVAPLAVEEKRAFFEAVGRALDTDDYWALFIVREDYLAAFAPYRDRIPTQMSNTFRLDLLGLEGAREAAEQAAILGGRAFPAVDQLIRDLSTVQVQQADGSFVAEQGLHVEPLHLQVVCRRLWEAMPEDDPSIDPEDIEKYAGVSTALGGYYADAVQKIARGDVAVERALREWVGQKLIVGGIRSQVRQERGRTAGLDNALVDALLGSYLVRTEHRAGANWFELSHDRLVEPVEQDNRAWEEEHLHPLQAQAKLWENGKRSQALLLSAEAVRDAAAWAAKNAALVTEGEREFLEQSQSVRARERAARLRLRALAAVAVAVAALMGMVVIWALGQQRRAQAAETAAYARELIARNQGAHAKMLLETTDPGKMRGWVQVVTDLLAQEIPKSTLRHEDDVWSASFSPDGKRILTASYDKTARVWNADGTGDPVVLKGHEDWVYAASWSPDGKRILTASYDKTARVWNADGTGDPVVLKGHENKLRSASWSPDSKRIVTASFDGTARVWNADGTGDPVVLRGHTRAVWFVAWSPDGKLIVTASEDKTARVWNADGTGDPALLKGHEDTVRFASWSPDGSRIVTTSLDKTARVWNADGSGQPMVLKGHERQIVSAWFSPDGKRIVTVSYDKTARVWNADGTGDPVVLRGHESTVSSAAWSPDGKRIVTASWDKTARVWGADGTSEPLVLRGHTDAVWSVSWSPDGKRIVTASADDTAFVWNAEPLVLRGHEATVFSASWSPDGKRIITASADSTARMWNADGTGAPVVLKGHEGPVTSAAWSPDGKWIATASTDKTARVWSADGTGEPVALKGHKGPVTSAAWSPDGKWIVTASTDKTARVWNADGTGEPVVLKGHEGPVTSASWSPDGKRIVTASEDRTARAWNADGTGEPVVLRGHADAVTFAAWSPDGKRIVTASLDKRARVWSADGTGEPVVLKGEQSKLYFASWSPDGKRIVTASEDRTARVWNADGTGEPLALKGHEGSVTSAAWSPDGKRIVTASQDHTARIWLIDIFLLRQAFHEANNDCLGPEQRQTDLLESDSDARAGYAACERSYGRTPFLPSGGKR